MPLRAHMRIQEAHFRPLTRQVLAIFPSSLALRSFRAEPKLFRPPVLAYWLLRYWSTCPRRSSNSCFAASAPTALGVSLGDGPIEGWSRSRCRRPWEELRPDWDVDRAIHETGE